MNKSESKYFNTARRMDQAFLELLDEKDFPYITVKEICKRAGVNRSTFYLHYETINDLLTEAIEGMNKEFYAYFGEQKNFRERLQNGDADSLNLITPEYLIPYLTYIKEHQRLFRTAFKQKTTLQTQETYDWLFEHVFDPILTRANVPKADRAYLMSFYIHGLMAIVDVWLEGNCTDDIEHICDLMQQCVKVSGAGASPRPSNEQRRPLLQVV